MVTIIRAMRRTPILTPSSLACLSALPTINLTGGCAHDCAYCYIQGYSGYPGQGSVVLYENTLAKLKAELGRTIRQPPAVFFSPSSDLFQPMPAVLAMAHDVLELLLREGIGVSIVTKGAIPKKTLTLLARHAGLVRVQVGIITIDETVASQFEVNAAPVRMRVEHIRQLVGSGISVEARVDPILPGITDGHDSLRALFGQLATAGVRKAAASVLFLRPAILSALRQNVPPDTLRLLLDAYRVHDRVPIRTAKPALVHALPHALREEILGRVRDVAAERAITVSICACKNPDLAAGTCNIAGTFPRRRAASRQPVLL
jgi:DNA repair photolyase